MNDNRIGMGVGLGAAALALGLGVGLGRVIHHWSAPAQQSQAQAALADAPKTASVSPKAGAQAQAQQPAGAPKRYMVPVSDSQPSLGPKDALVTIVQWCDLPDPRCATLEPTLRDILAKNPSAVRLVFRHYGRPDHPGSAIAHHFVRAAHQQAGKFWEARALLLAHQGEFTLADAERYSDQLGLTWKDVRSAIEQRSFATPITADRIFAGMFDVHDSPALFVNGRSLGDLPQVTQLRQLVDEELRRAVDLMASGVDKADLYAELTKHGAWNKPQTR